MSFFIFGSVFNADFLSSFNLPWDNISAPRQSPVQRPAPGRLLPPAWQGPGTGAGRVALGTRLPGFGDDAHGSSQCRRNAGCHSESPEPGAGCFVLTRRGTAASRGCPSHWEHPSCSSAGCSPRAPEMASDPSAPGLAHP